MMEGDDGDIKLKPARKRTKLIRNLMEFYFSDANLRKDRFLSKKLQETVDGYVNLELFQNFNKLAKLTQDMDVVLTSLKYSNVIEISEDRKRLRRKVKWENKMTNNDECTLYVENYPITADHEWIKKNFSRFGEVAYVSMPKFPSTQDYKGFAFIEFTDKESVSKVLKEFKESVSDRNFPKGSKDYLRIKRQVIETFGEDAVRSMLPKANKIEEKYGTELPLAAYSDSKKRKLCQVEEPDYKKLKTGEKFEADDDNASGDNVNDDEGKKKSEFGIKKMAGDAMLLPGKDPRSPKKKYSSDIRCLSKSRWRELKEEYLRRQKEQMSQWKKLLQEARRKRLAEEKLSVGTQLPYRVGCVAELTCHCQLTPTAIKKELLSVSDVSYLKMSGLVGFVRCLKPSQLDKLFAHKFKDFKLSLLTGQGERNYWEKVQKEQLPIKEEEIAAASHSHEFVAGSILAVSCARDLTRKELKECTEKFAEVAYFDFVDGCRAGHVRCLDGENAKKLLALELDSIAFQLLQGEEERSYWEKIKRDREAKLTSKRKKIRGAAKLLAKAEAHRSHIKFDS